MSERPDPPVAKYRYTLEVTGNMHVLWDCGDDLRAVLGSDAHTEQKGTGR